MPALPVAVSSPDAARRWVACLCADWCGTCRDYRPLFEQVAAQHAGMRFVWLDIEDEAELVGELDIETFPTLLVGQGPQLCFAGPLLPHAGTLSRLLAALDGPGAAVADPALLALAAAINARLGLS
jgi:thioredoxin 1